MEDARLAVAADLPVIGELAAAAASEAAERRGGPLFLTREAWSPDTSLRFERALESRDAVLVVGSYDGVVFGYGLATVEEVGDGARLGTIEDLFVDPELRKVGIGEAMMDLLLDRLRQAGCSGVDSRAMPGDRHTKNFFESYGLKARLLIVHRRLDGEPDQA